MYMELGDIDDEDDKENTPGTKLFTVSKDTEAFLKHRFTARVDNPVRRQWREKHGVPRRPTTACPKLAKIMKRNLSSQTKLKLSKTQTLVLDAVGPLAFVLEAAGQGNLTQEAAVDGTETSAATWPWRGETTSTQA